jgi:ERCC4-type nuclease
MQLKIDSREQNNSVRYNTCINHFKEKGYTVTTEQLPTGDYIFNDQVVMEFKTWSDFMSSITDGRLWNESQKQMENFDIHFIVIHGTNRDYQEAFQHNGLENKHITGAIARLNTYTKIIHGTRTLPETFELMRVTAEKCLDDKTLVRQFGTKSINPAFNALAYGVDDISGERAKSIVNFLHLKTFKDVCRLTYDDLIKVPGIGDILAKQILDAIGK